MGRPRINQLQLAPIAGKPGMWRLWGMVNGVRVRQRGADIAVLERAKIDYEKQLVDQAQPRLELRHTWLSAEQLRDAEAAVLRSGGIRLVDRVIASEKVMPATARIPCEDALHQWVADLRARRRYERTVEKNEDRVNQFLTFIRPTPKYLTDITPEMVERFVFRKGTQGYTALTDAAVIQAWLRFCRRRRWLAIVPFEIDMKDLTETSRPAQPARILDPDRAGALLLAAARVAGGRMVPYTVLTGWLMLRHAEALRTTADQIKLQVPQPVVEVHPRKRRTASYRAVSIPANVLPFIRTAVARRAFIVERKGQPQPGVFFSKRHWETIRAEAGLMKLHPPAHRGGRRRVSHNQWQENLLRHTGISYLHQETGGDIKRVCREAGNSDDTAFRHYLQLPVQGASKRFYSRELVAPALRAYRAS